MRTTASLALKAISLPAPHRLRPPAPRQKRPEPARGVTARLIGLAVATLVWSAGTALFLFY